MLAYSKTESFSTANIHCVSSASLLLITFLVIMRQSYFRTPNFYPDPKGNRRKRKKRRKKRKHKLIGDKQTVLTHLIAEIESHNTSEQEPQTQEHETPLHPLLEETSNKIVRTNPLIPKAKARTLVKERLQRSGGILSLFYLIEEASSRARSGGKRPKLTCPVCDQSEHVQRNGRASDGQQKWVCKNHHDTGVKRKTAGYVYFRDHTSREGLQCTQLLLKEIARHLLLTTSSYSEISDLKGVSRYLVEFTASMISTNVRRFISKIVPSKKRVALYSFDCGGTGFRASFGLAMGDVEEQPIVFSWKGSEAEAFRQFIRFLKEEELYQRRRRKNFSIFLVDGAQGFLEIWAEEVPEAILVRQIHSEKGRGLVLCHWFYKGKEYTSQIPWNLLLHEGTAGKRTQNKRKRRHSLGRRPRASRSIPKEIRIWENRRTSLYLPRPRKSRDAKRNKPESDDPVTMPANGIPDGEKNPTDRCVKIKPKAGLPAKLIFVGPASDAKKLPSFRFLYEKLRTRFAGIYITTNNVEGEISEFKRLNTKSRSPNSGDTLFNVHRARFYIRRQKMTPEDVEMLLDEIFTTDAINRHMIIREKRAGAGGTRRGGITEGLVSAINNGEAVEICYTDSDGIKMPRIVEPLDITEENGNLFLEAYCRLRKDHRRFRVPWIDSVVPTELLSEFRLCKYPKGLLMSYNEASDKVLFCEERGLNRTKVHQAWKRYREKEDLIESLMDVEIKRTRKGNVRWTDELIEALLIAPDLKAFCKAKDIPYRSAKRRMTALGITDI
jgi:transposase-like protein